MPMRRNCDRCSIKFQPASYSNRLCCDCAQKAIIKYWEDVRKADGKSLRERRNAVRKEKVDKQRYVSRSGIGGGQEPIEVHEV